MSGFPLKYTRILVNTKLVFFFRTLRLLKDFVKPRIFEIPGASGKLLGKSFRSVFSVGLSHLFKYIS